MQTTAAMGYAIIAEATLYLGLGAEPGEPSWGSMLYQAQSYLTSAWWMAFFPGMAIFFAVLGFNLLGDGVAKPRSTNLRLESRCARRTKIVATFSIVAFDPETDSRRRRSSSSSPSARSCPGPALASGPWQRRRWLTATTGQTGSSLWLGGRLLMRPSKV